MCVELEVIHPKTIHMEEIIMLTRAKLNDEAKSLSEKHQFRDDAGKLLSTNAQIFHENLRIEVQNFKDFIGQNPKPNDDDISVQRRILNKALALYNDEMRVQRLEYLKTLGSETALIMFLGNQRTEGLAIEENKKEDTVTIIETKHVGIDSTDFYGFMCSADLDYLKDVCCIFADNIARRKVADDGKDGKNTYITKASMSDSYIALRKKLHDTTGINWVFDNPADISNNDLCKELNYVVGRLCFLSGDDIKGQKWLIKMLNPDWKFVRDTIVTTNGAQKAKDNEEKKGDTNTEGKYIIRDEMTIIRAIFKAMYTRYHKLSYGYATQTNSAEKSRVSEPNRDMAESSKAKEFEKKATPEAGPVVLGTPESK